MTSFPNASGDSPPAEALKAMRASLGPILGDERCEHGNLVYYRSGYQGTYAVCQACGGHLWGDTEEGIAVPQGVVVIDLDAWYDDPDDDSPVVMPDALDKWRESVKGWGEPAPQEEER